MRVRSEVYLGSCLDIQHFGGVIPFSVPAPNGLKSCSKAFKYLAAPTQISRNSRLRVTAWQNAPARSIPKDRAIALDETLSAIL